MSVTRMLHSVSVADTVFAARYMYGGSQNPASEDRRKFDAMTDPMPTNVSTPLRPVSHKRCMNLLSARSRRLDQSPLTLIRRGGTQQWQPTRLRTNTHELPPASCWHTRALRLALCP
ncbi:hypothetical protein CBL_13686 [Carabus blaptoides fortunei]